MTTLTIRKFSETTRMALKLRAKNNHRSMEEEARVILRDGLARPRQMGFGSQLAAIGRKHGITNADIDAIEAMRDRTPAQPMSFE